MEKELVGAASNLEEMDGLGVRQWRCCPATTPEKKDAKIQDGSIGWVTSSGVCTGTNCQRDASVQGRGQVSNGREAPRRQGSAVLPVNIWGAEKVGDERRCLFVLELPLACIFILLLKWESGNFTENRPISWRVAKRKGMWLNKITDLLVTQSFDLWGIFLHCFAVLASIKSL